MKLEVGQKLYKAPDRYNKEITEYTVTKVGRKNFEVSPDYRGGGKFVIETRSYVNPNYMQNNFKLYLSPQDIEDEKRLNELHNKIASYFRGYGRLGLNMEQSEKIIEILGI
jgi:hypothetical protein